MATYDWPTAVPIRRISWTPPEADVMSRSAWTGQTQVVTLAGPARWAAKVELPPLNPAQQQAYKAFRAQLRGRINSFRLFAADRTQLRPDGLSPNVGWTQAGGSGYSFRIGALPVSSATVLKAGQMLTLIYADGSGDEQLFELTADLVADSTSAATAYVSTPLRRTTIAASGPNVELRLPWALMRKTAPQGWGVGPAIWYDNDALECEEAF